MVEMVETAAILNQAGERSLVILDEIGRGTATFDGLSIAWATIEQLHEQNRCRALFATHFHELTALAGEAAAPVQCHGAGEGMAGRGRVPARGRAGRRRPLLRHPGGEARRPAGRRDRARQDGAGDARSGEPRSARATSPTCRCSPRYRARPPHRRRLTPPAWSAARSPPSIPTISRHAKPWRRSTGSSSWRRTVRLEPCRDDPRRIAILIGFPQVLAGMLAFFAGGWRGSARSLSCCCRSPRRSSACIRVSPAAPRPPWSRWRASR